MSTLTICRRPLHRRRGSVYILTLSVAMLLTVIGLAGLLRTRVDHWSGRRTEDMVKARAHALSAIDMGLYEIDTNPTWRSAFALGGLPTNVPLAGGNLSLKADDSVDGDLNNNTTDPVVLTGIGTFGEARHQIQVTVKFVAGQPQFLVGTWMQVVD